MISMEKIEVLKNIYLVWDGDKRIQDKFFKTIHFTYAQDKEHILNTA